MLSTWSTLLNYTNIFILAAILMPPARLSAATLSTTNTTDTTVVQLAEIVIHENRIQTSYAAQNRNVRVIDSALLTLLPASSIQEVLGHVAGADVRPRGPFGSQADISVDGGTFEQTLILVNGIRMLDAQTAHHALNLPIPLESVERIEVIRGPSARIYGINSLTGAINIITKQATTSGLRLKTTVGTSFRGSASNHGERSHQSGDAATPTGLYHGRDVLLSGDYVAPHAGSHSLSVHHTKGNGHRYNTGYTLNRLFYQSKWKNLSLMTGYVSSDFGANGFYAAPGDRDAREIVGTGFFALSSLIPLSTTLHITPKVSFRQTDDDYRYFGNDLSKGRSEHRGNSITPELHFTWNTEYGDLGWGAEWRREYIKSSNIGQHRRSNYGSYAEFRTHISSILSLNAGTYINYHSDYGWQVFPGIDLGLQLNRHLKWTIHSGTGQRIPSFSDLFLDQLPGNIGNPLIKPEEAWHIESGLKYSGRQSLLQAHYFYRSIENFIDWVHPIGSTPPYQAHNFNQQQVQGVSFGWDWWSTNEQTEHQWRLGWHYTFLLPRYSDPEILGYVSKYSIESLKHQLTSQVSYKNKNFTALAAVRYHERISYASYVLADARISHQFGAVGVFLDLNNMLDVSYIGAAATPMPGRWYQAGVNVNFF